MSVRDEMREKLPASVAKYRSSRLVAIRLFCVECMGGSTRDAATCADRSCWIWPHGPAARKERMASKAPGEQPAHLKKAVQK